MEFICDTEGITVCRCCVGFRNLEPGSVREHVWYNHLCLASPLPRGLDPYDGEEKPYLGNDLGRQCFVEERAGFHFCRDVNDGHCELFREE